MFNNRVSEHRLQYGGRSQCGFVGMYAGDFAVKLDLKVGSKVEKFDGNELFKVGKKKMSVKSHRKISYSK